MRIESTPGFDPAAERARARYGDTLGRAIVPPRCHLYLRVSSPEQDMARGRDGRRIRQSRADRDREVKRSLDTQEAEGKDYAERMGYHVVEVYRETFTSLEFWGRPELARLRAAIARGEVDVMVVLKMERLGATSIELAVLENLLQQHGGRLEFVQQTFEDGPIGRIGKTVFAEFNTFRIENLKEQFSRARVARVQAGRPLHGSRPPTGCEWTDEDRTCYRFVEPGRTIAGEVYEHYDGGWSRRRIIRWLNGRGIPPPAGGPTWNDNTLQDLLSNPVYCGRPMAYRWKGIRRPGATAGGRPRKRSVRRPADDPNPPRLLEKALATGPGELPPPVSVALWERVQQRLEQGRAASGARGGRPPAEPDGWPLRGGILCCSGCQRPMTSGASGGTPVYECGTNHHGSVRCPKPVSVTRPVAEAYVWAETLAHARDPQTEESVVQAYEVAQAKRVPAVLESRRAAVLATLEDVRRQAEACRADLREVKTDFARALLREDLDRFGQQAERLTADLESIDAEAEGADAAQRERLDTLEALRLVRERFGPEETYDEATKRLLINVLVDRATVFPRGVPGRARGGRRIDVDFVVDGRRYRAALEALEPGAVRGTDTVHLRNLTVTHTPALTLRRSGDPDGAVSVRP